jgi:Cys-rich repeat protein
MSRLPNAAVFAVAVFALTLGGCACEPGVRCTQRADCSDPSKPYCASALGACVECIENAQCAAGQVCNAIGACEPGCTEGSCETGQVCKPGQGCVQCVTDVQCGPQRVCANDLCVMGCSAANPGCPTGLVCDTDSRKCVGCVDRASCQAPGQRVCNPATQTCVACLADTDCPEPGLTTCDPQSHECVQCTGDTQCPVGNLCTANRCVPGCSATRPCAAGAVCSNIGQCVMCLGDNDCGGATPRCDVPTNRCVACLPGAGDNCGVGWYCRPDLVCERGCKTGADCPSGVCLPSHSCQSCTADTQCVAGSVCQGGTCVAACSATNPCGAGNTCCNGRCEAVQTDVNNCGACGRACGAGQTCCAGACKRLDMVTDCGSCGNVCGTGGGCCGAKCEPLNSLTNCGTCGNVCGADQFCDGTTCRNQTFPEFCANRAVYAIRDGVPLDDVATNTLASTISTNCSAQTNLQYGPQTNPAWVDQDAGTLLLGGGSTVVTAGGPFPNKPVRWLERTRQVTKVYFSSNGLDTFYFKKRSDNSTLVTRAQTWCNVNRDVFVVQLTTDPISGTLALLAYGLCSPGNGTQTAAWYWANVMLPQRARYTDSWYLFEWVDTNLNGLPEVTDTFTQLASGQ